MWSQMWHDVQMMCLRVQRKTASAPRRARVYSGRTPGAPGHLHTFEIRWIILCAVVYS